MRRTRAFGPAVPTFVAAATLVAYTGLSVPISTAAAVQDDQPTLDVIEGLNGTLDLFGSLAGAGALAEQLPGLALTPGSAAAIGLSDLLTTTRDAKAGGATWGDVNSLEDLVDKVDDVGTAALPAGDDIGDGRRVDLTATKDSTDGVHTITVDVTARRVVDTGVDIASTSPKFSFTAADGIAATIELAASFTMVYSEDDRHFRLLTNDTTPSLGLTVATAIPDLSQVSAGVGILGVGLDAGSTYNLSATLAATFDDPDGDGTLAFTEPDGLGGTRAGELAAGGVGAGITGVALTAGTLASTLHLTALTSDYVDLTAADVSVSVSSPNLLTTPPAVSVVGGSLAGIDGFLNLSPRDLAQGLAEIATTVVALQRAGGADLPFLRGSIGDAVQATEGIVEFLAEHVEASDDPALPGRPDFASIQELLDLLVDENSLPSGVDFGVVDGEYDGDKLRFDLTLTRAAGPAEPLNALGTATSGDGTGTTYAPLTLTDSGQDFSDQPGEAASYVGRQVLVGASSAIIAGASGTTLTLDPSAIGNAPANGAWQGGTPANGTPYSISAGDPRTGLVELGNVLGTAGSIRNANAKTAVAQVSPSYTLTLPIALDLRPGSTTDCDPGPGTGCPFQHTQNGITTIITELPLPADRILIETGRDLLVADAPITSAVTVDATVGFVGVTVTGELRACTTQATANCTGGPAVGTHLLELGLAPFGDADNDATLPEVGKRLTDALTLGTPADLAAVLTSEVNGQAWASLSVDVPGANGFFGGSGAAATVTLPDITNPGGVSVSAPDLAKLVPLDFDPSNPLALFGVLLADLQGLQSMLDDLPGGAAALDTQIPLVGRSLSDLIGSGVSGGGSTVSYTGTSITDTARSFDLSYLGRRVQSGTTSAVVVGASGSTLTLSPWNVTPASGSAYEIDSEIQGVVNLLTAAPPASLQDALALLENGLGIDGGAGEALGFTVDTSGTDPVLRLDVDWQRSVEKTLPINLSFDLGPAEKSLIGAASHGVLETTVSGGISLGLEMPLTVAAAAAPLTHLRVDPDSSIDAKAGLSGDGLRLTTNIGPFQLSLGNPDTGQPAGTELEAAFGVSLSDTTHSDPVSLADFAGALELTMANDVVTCAGAPSTAELAACAVLPVYLNGTPISPADNAFVLRLPRTATDLVDAFDLSGPEIEAGVPRFAYPPDLASKLATAGLNMLTVGEGLFAYVEFLENALQVASGDGKLPLIGKDLQAGSTFLEDLRLGLQSAFGGAPTNPTAGEIKDFLNDNVAPVLPGWTGDLPVQFECSVFLETPEAPTVVATTDGVVDTDYHYRIVASVNDPSEDGLPGPASAVVSNSATLDGAHYNDVSWSAVEHATGYKVLRRAEGETDFTLVGEVTAPTVTFTDDEAASTAYSAAASNPQVVPCPDSAPADSVTGFSVAIDIGAGTPSSADGCTGPDCLSSTLPLDLGIPGLSFKANDVENDKIVATLGWTLHLEFGLTRDDGFFVRTQDQALPEFMVGASLDLPADMQAQLAFFDIDIAKTDGVTTPLLRGAFSIDLKDAAGSPDCHDGCVPTSEKKLTFDTLKGSSLDDLVVPKLTAGVNIDWAVKATVDSALPGIGARFLLVWDWTSDAPTDFSNLSELAFKDVVIDPGAFLASNIGPIINQIISVFKPVQPIIDTILAPLPVLSDLSKLAGGDDVTIASLAETFSTLAGGPDIGPFIEVIKVIKTLSGLVGDCGGPSFCVTVGDFDIKKELALGTANSAATAASLVSATDTGDPLNNPFKQLSAKSGNKLGDAAAAAPALANAACANGKRGISFPALENPTSLFGLLLNQDVEIACFDSGPLTLGFEMNLRLGPVYAPPPVYIVISGGASVSLRIAAGFDTYGIRTAVEAGKIDATILDSIYFKTTDTTGAPLPVVKFTGFLAAGASVSAVVIEVGVTGGIELTVAFTWNDPNNDGKFRFNEFLATALNNPICLFNVGGQLDLFISVFITLGISPFSVSFDFELVRIKLLDFSLKPNCEPPPPRLGGTKGTTLYLFAGKYSGDSERGAPWGSGNTADEGWIVRQLPDDPDTDGDQTAVVVQALGITETFPDPGGAAITAVVLDGRGYAGKLKVVFNGGGKGQPFDKDTYVFGGSGADTIRTGSGDSYVDAGPGDDNVSTTDRPDLSVPVADSGRAVVAGGTGKDGVTVGNGDSFAHGDGALAFGTTSVSDVVPLTGGNVTLSSVIDISTVGVPSDGAAGTEHGDDGPDIVSAGIGGADLWGGGGDDTLGTANDSPLATLPANAATKQQYVAQKNVIVGGSGSDRIKSGSASDDVYTGAKVATGEDDAGSGDADTDVNTVDTGTGSDTVYGSNGKDNVTTGSFADQSATVYGGAANDILAGGDGTDELYGGPGDDYVIAEPSTVDTVNLVPDALGSAYTVTRVNRPSSNSTKLLAGGGGSDRLYGGNGTASIFGDRQDFVCVAGDPVPSDAPTEAPTVSDPADAAVDDADDLILGGNGVDTVNAGGGADHVLGKGGNDLLCGNAGDDRIYAGGGADSVWGGSGADTAYGDGDDDRVFGNAGADYLYGGSGIDVLEGNSGVDTAFGGTDADVVVGGTRAAARSDDGDTLYGDSGEDVLIGDNGIPGTLYDLASVDPSLGGADLIWGGPHDDDAFGGLEDDEVHGGDGADQLEGNPGSDDVYGEAGADNLIGGSSQLDPSDTYPDEGDLLDGGSADDVIAGDNAVITDADGAGTAITKGRGLTVERAIVLFDLGLAPGATKSGPDVIHGGDGPDVLLGQGANDVVHGEGGDDYAEGGQANDTVEGGSGQDDLVGGGHTVRGSGTGQARAGQLDMGDTVRGGDGSDLLIGDNGQILRGTTDKSDVTKNRGGMTERLVEIYDLGDGPHEAVSGADWLLGENEPDVILGQSGDDRITGGAAQDYAEGGPGGDWIEGNDGRDDLVGGSSTPLGSNSGRTTKGQLDGADVIWGGAGDDLVLGDNAVVSRTGDMHELTYRLGTDPAGAITDRRAIQLLDLEPTAGNTLSVPTGRFGADRLSGQGGVDVILGQDGDDLISGGSDDDYVEGHGGADTVTGDSLLALPVDTWPATPSAGVELDGGDDGQDDLIGGRSEAGYRDAGDTIRGNGGADFVLGDNGTAVRQIVDHPTLEGVLMDRLYTLRYPAVPPAGAAKIRVADSDFVSTRFCTAALAQQCERTNAWGSDQLFGDGGDDVLYGQDGDDTIRGGTEDDTIYGELGNDLLFGDEHDDAILGDRGGVRQRYENGGRAFTRSVTQVPKVSFTGFGAGTVTPETDLFHDVDGDAFVGAGSTGKMVHDGITKGGNDRIRGGTGRDSIHAGFGDDLANGDSGGDTVFGDDGADVLWGGKGCDPVTDTPATAPICFPEGIFDPAPHQPDGSTWPQVTDYLFGGKGGTSTASMNGALGSDLLDWRPRGTYYAGPSTCTTNAWPTDLQPGGKKAPSTTVDPCAWFEMTELQNDLPKVDAGQPGHAAYLASIADNQHHAGIDWQYGGWDRDVLQGDVADNGPNEGDRLLDWNGTFNLYTHCNSAYGGFNDVRQHSPSWQEFLQRMAYALGAGQDTGNGPLDTMTPGTSGYVELALVYPGEKDAGSGKAFPATPGHFADPDACSP